MPDMIYKETILNRSIFPIIIKGKNKTSMSTDAIYEAIINY